MAIENALKKKIATELIEWIYLGIRTGMRRGIEAYQNLLASNPAEAQAEFDRALDLPSRANDRIQAAVAVYGQDYITECLALYGDITLDEIFAEINTLIAYTAQLETDYQNGNKTAADVAADIAANVEKESDKWVFSIPVDRIDLKTSVANSIQANSIKNLKASKKA
jgi:hypothetical protein